MTNRPVSSTHPTPDREAKTNKAPAFQFYPCDFIADLNVQLMTTTQVGAYILLLCHDWSSDGLPDDPEDLALLARMDLETFRVDWKRRLEKCFEAHPAKPGHLTNPRLLKERDKQAAFRAKQSAAGAKGGRPRLSIAAENPDKSSGFSKEKPEKALHLLSLSSASATTSVALSATGEAEWLTPYYQEYSRVRGEASIVPLGSIVRILGRLHREYGEERTFSEFSAYLGRVDVQYESWPKFGAGFGRWNEGRITAAEVEAVQSIFGQGE